MNRENDNIYRSANEKGKNQPNQQPVNAKKSGCLISLLKVIFLLPLILLFHKKTRPYFLAVIIGLGLFLGIRKISGGEKTLNFSQIQEDRKAKQEAIQLEKGDEEKKKGNTRSAIEYYKKAGEAGAQRIQEIYISSVNYYYESYKMEEAFTYLVNETGDNFTEESAFSLLMDIAEEDIKKIYNDAMGDVCGIKSRIDSLSASKYLKRLDSTERWLKENQKDSDRAVQLLSQIQEAKGYVLIIEKSYYPDWEEVAQLWSDCKAGSKRHEILTAVKEIQAGNVKGIHRLKKATSNSEFVNKVIKVEIPDLYHIKTDSVTDYLELYGISRWAKYRTEPLPKNLKQSFTSKNDLIRVGIDYHGPYMTLNKDHVAQLKETCGKAAAGKILVLHRQQVFQEKERELNICTEIMEKLPDSSIPATLEEVEYVIYMDTTYTVRGQYQVGTKAIVETTKLTLYSAVTGESLYTASVKGEISNTMYYNGKVPRYYSAGSPEMRESLYNAVQKILENQ